MYFHRILLASCLMLFPVSVSAVSNVFALENLIINLIEKLGYFFWIFAIALFFWGLVKFIKNAADTDEHEKGKHLMIWGIIAFTVLFSLWAIVKILLVDTLGITASPLNYVNKDGGSISGCNDGIDNDSDGSVDFPSDSGCSSSSDGSEG